MGFLERRQSRNRIPDLSRYQQSQPQGYNPISYNAANSALRTYSLNSNSFNPYQSSRSNSFTRNSRANSLRSNNSFNGYGRSNSLSSRSNEPEIIIHTTKTMDEYGRTKSITTETIRRLGSFELVKTETKTPPIRSKKLLSPPIMKYAGSLNSQELESIREEEELPIRPKRFNKQSSPLINEDSESGDSIYSDAFETLPIDTRENVKITENIPKIKKKVSIEDVPSGVVEVPRNEELSEGEMYERAYEVAMKKVYGNTNETSYQPYQPQSRTNSLTNRSLRNMPIRNHSRAPSITGSIKSNFSNNGFKRYSMRDGLEKGNKKNYNYQLNNKFGVPDVSTPPTTTTPIPTTTPTTDTKSKPKKKFWSKLFKKK